MGDAQHLVVDGMAGGQQDFGGVADSLLQQGVAHGALVADLAVQGVGLGTAHDVVLLDLVLTLHLDGDVGTDRDALNAQLNDANAENARLKNLLAQKKDATAAVKEYVGTPVSVFFNINKSVIASKKDLVNVKNMAEYAKDNNANLLVTGYADSATGKPAYNQKLSEKRAETVANELVKMGVSRDQITTEAKGGVKDLSPISYNRRATVQVK